MQCSHPFYHKDHKVLLPCGKCIACRLARARDWSIRISQDIYQKSTTASFFTLTYADNPRSLIKTDLQLYIKRVREFLRRNFPDKLKNFAYYACGEYGDERGRPHFHILFIGLSSPWCRRHLQHLWLKGFTYIKPVTLYRINYVTGYLRKKTASDMKYYDDNALAYPFQLQSQGIGKCYYEAHKQELNDTGIVKFRGKDCSMPKYYFYLMNRDEDPNFHHTQKYLYRAENKIAYNIQKWLRSPYSLKYINSSAYDFDDIKNAPPYAISAQRNFEVAYLLYTEDYLPDVSIQLESEFDKYSLLRHKGKL